MTVKSPLSLHPAEAMPAPRLLLPQIQELMERCAMAGWLVDRLDIEQGQIRMSCMDSARRKRQVSALRQPSGMWSGEHEVLAANPLASETWRPISAQVFRNADGGTFFYSREILWVLCHHIETSPALPQSWPRFLMESSFRRPFQLIATEHDLFWEPLHEGRSRVLLSVLPTGLPAGHYAINPQAPDPMKLRAWRSKRFQYSGRRLTWKALDCPIWTLRELGAPTLPRPPEEPLEDEIFEATEAP